MTLLEMLKRKNNESISKPEGCMINRAEYIEFKNSEDAESWARPIWGDWLWTERKGFAQASEKACAAQCALEQDIRSLISCYYVSASAEINNFLRRNKPMSPCDPDYMKITDQIRNELLKFKLPDNIVVYRFLDRDYSNFIELGFTSTSLVYDILANHISFKNKPIAYKIYLPKGTKGAYLGFDVGSSNQTECEFLLPPGAVITIFNEYKNTDGRIIYECVLTQ